MVIRASRIMIDHDLELIFLVLLVYRESGKVSGPSGSQTMTCGSFFSSRRLLGFVSFLFVFSCVEVSTIRS